MNENIEIKIDTNNNPNDTMNKVFASAQKILDGVEDHKRMILSDLIDKVVAETHCKISVVQGLIALFLEKWKSSGEGEVHIGRTGGLYKGGKTKRVDCRPRCHECNQVIPKNKRITVIGDIKIEQ